MRLSENTCCGLFLLCLSVFTSCNGISPGQYNAERQRVITKERSEKFGASLTLSPDEKKLNSMLLQAKQDEINVARINGSIYPPALSYFNTKKLIQKSKIFQVIQRMPKGGALHTHDSSIASLEWVVKNVTYRPNCYMCIDKDGELNMYFSKQTPQKGYCTWVLVRDARQMSGNPDLFDQQMMKNMSIVADDLEKAYPTVNDVWKKFGGYFKAIGGIFTFEPVFKDYALRSLQEFRDDNVQYIEIRALLLPVYDLDGTTHGAEYVLNLYRDVVKQFMAANKDFIGCKIIQSAVRTRPVKDILTSLKQAIMFYQKHPDIFRGFDLVGQEGTGQPLQYYLNDLLYPSQQNPPVQIPYFFHAGETDWEGTRVDLNVLDAVLLNTSRIGHGFALYKHPEVMKMVKERDIAIEVNPISNQVLRLVTDLRNHGAVTLFAENFPLVVSSDDHAVWDALPLSHDFYMAFMAMTGKEDGLKVLKQLALNSIKYSAMTANEQQVAMVKWKTKWDAFVQDMLGIY